MPAHSMIPDRKKINDISLKLLPVQATKDPSSQFSKTSTLTDQKTEVPASCTAIQFNSLAKKKMFLTAILVVCVLTPFCGVGLCCIEKYFNRIFRFVYFIHIFGGGKKVEILYYIK